MESSLKRTHPDDNSMLAILPFVVFDNTNNNNNNNNNLNPNNNNIVNNNNAPVFKIEYTFNDEDPCMIGHIHCDVDYALMKAKHRDIMFNPKLHDFLDVYDAKMKGESTRYFILILSKFLQQGGERVNEAEIIRNLQALLDIPAVFSFRTSLYSERYSLDPEIKKFFIDVLFLTALVFKAALVYVKKHYPRRQEDPAILPFEKMVDACMAVINNCKMVMAENPASFDNVKALMGQYLEVLAVLVSCGHKHTNDLVPVVATNAMFCYFAVEEAFGSRTPEDDLIQKGALTVMYALTRSHPQIVYDNLRRNNSLRLFLESNKKGAILGTKRMKWQIMCELINGCMLSAPGLIEDCGLYLSPQITLKKYIALDYNIEEIAFVLDFYKNMLLSTTCPIFVIPERINLPMVITRLACGPKVGENFWKAMLDAERILTTLILHTMETDKQKELLQYKHTVLFYVVAINTYVDVPGKCAYDTAIMALAKVLRAPAQKTAANKQLVNELYQQRIVSHRGHVAKAVEDNIMEIGAFVIAEAPKNPAKKLKSEDSRKCVVCLENDRDHVVLPCAHLCVCATCATTVTALCPVCRTNVAEVKQIFM